MRNPETRRTYRETHREQIRVYNENYRIAHGIKLRPANRVKWSGKSNEHRAYMSRWRREHRAEWNAIISNYRHHKRANGGNFSPAAWAHLKTLFGQCCAYCKRRVKRLTQDHIIPISKGGWHVSMNIVPACQSCNSRKGNRPLQGRQIM